MLVTDKIIAAFMLYLVGTYPEFLYQMLPWENSYVPYEPHSYVNQRYCSSLLWPLFYFK
jgi:hypothetical protein